MVVENGPPSPDEQANSWRQFEQDYYVLLGVARNASSHEIRDRFLSLSREFHPDRRRQDDSDIVAAANAQYAVLDRAYKVLIDPVKRHAYDMYGEKGLHALEQDCLARHHVVATHLTTPDEIQRFLVAVLRRQHEQALEAHFVSHSEMSMHVDASDLVQAPMQGLRHLCDRGTRYVECTQMAISQRTEFPVAHNTLLTLGGYMYDRHGMGVGNFTAALAHTSCTPSFPSFTLSSQLGWAPTLQCQVSQPVSRYTVVSVVPALQEDGSLDMAIGASQLVAPQLHGSMTWSPRAGLAGALSHRTETCTTTAAVAVNAKSPNASIHLRRTMSVATTLKLSLRAHMLTGLSLAAGTSRALSHRTRLAIGLLLARAGVTLQLGCTRGSVRFVVPIFLSPFSPQSAWYTFCAATSPLVVAAVVTQLVQPVRARQQQLAYRQRHARCVQYLAAAYQRAQAQQHLMLRGAEKSMAYERQRRNGKGLLIVQGRYGTNPTNADAKDGRGGTGHEEGSHEGRGAVRPPWTHTCVDVTIPLRFFVKDGTLALSAASKAGLLGFYNPCVHELQTVADARTAVASVGKPLLYVRYVYDGLVFEATFDDDQAVSLPSKYAQAMGPVGRVY